MKTRKERRKAEKERKAKVAKFDRSKDPAHQFAKRAVDYQPRRGGQWVGLSKTGAYVGEAGLITAEWQLDHEACNHGYSTGSWWAGLAGQEPLEFPNQDAAVAFLTASGASRVGTVPVMASAEGFLPEEESDLNVVFAGLSEWGAYGPAGQALGEGGTITAYWNQILGDYFPGHPVGHHWVRVFPKVTPRVFPTLVEAQAVLLSAGAKQVLTTAELMTAAHEQGHRSEAIH